MTFVISNLTQPCNSRSYARVRDLRATCVGKTLTSTRPVTPKHALQTRGPRILGEEDRKGVRQSYEWKLHDPGFGIKIDNSSQTPEETADLIADYIKRGKDCAIERPR